MRKTATIIVIIVGTWVCLSGCDMLTGGGQQEAPPPAPALAPPPPPGPPGAPQPGQLAAPPAAPVPGQPPAVPAPPGAPVAAPTPGQPAAAPAAAPVPGQPAPTPVTVPGQPAVPVQPVAAPAPGQPAPVPGQPAVAPAAPVPTGDALTDKLNAKKHEVAADFTPTSALLKQELQKNKPQSYQVQLPGPPFCHTFIAVADDKVKNIDLTVDSPAGVKEATDDQKESTAVIANHCPTAPGAYKLTAAIPKGKGEFAIQVFSK